MPIEISTIRRLLSERKQWLLDRWLNELSETSVSGSGRIGHAEVRQQAEEFVDLLLEALQSGGATDTNDASWQKMRAFLDAVSASRAVQGFSSSQTATFFFSFKKPLFAAAKETLQDDPTTLVEIVSAMSDLLDQLGLKSVQAYQRTREDVISRQQAEMLELSTPVVKLWDGVLALPMIGTLDSSRTQVVMETLLERIVETGSQMAIIDITGVPTVDTLVAQHLMKTVTAIRLMGADCIVSGVRPQIAQTIVHLGVDLGGVTTKASLADALALALRRSGVVFTKRVEGQS